MMAGTQLGPSQPLYRLGSLVHAKLTHSYLSTHTQVTYIDMPHIHTDREMAGPSQPPGQKSCRLGFLSNTGQSSYVGQRAQGGGIWGQWKGWALSVAHLIMDTLTVPACPKQPQWF